MLGGASRLCAVFRSLHKSSYDPKCNSAEDVGTLICHRTCIVAAQASDVTQRQGAVHRQEVGMDVQVSRRQFFKACAAGLGGSSLALLGFLAAGGARGDA